MSPRDFTHYQDICFFFFQFQKSNRNLRVTGQLFMSFLPIFGSIKAVGLPPTAETFKILKQTETNQQNIRKLLTVDNYIEC